MLGARAEQITFTLRTLVDDAALWTRILLVAHETGSSELPYAADGAVNAANAVGTVFSSFYGIDVGTEVGRQVHLVMITDGFAYSFAAESGDTATAGTLYAKWLTDADAFAAYLAPLVSETSTGSLERLLHVYVTETGAEIKLGSRATGRVTSTPSMRRSARHEPCRPSWGAASLNRRHRRPSPRPRSCVRLGVLHGRHSCARRQAARWQGQDQRREERRASHPLRDAPVRRREQLRNVPALRDITTTSALLRFLGREA